MIGCINKKDKNYIALENKYGDGLADLFTRVYSFNKKLLPEGEFYIPTEKEFFRWYDENRQQKRQLVSHIIENNIEISEGSIKRLLRGIVHTFKNELYITSGWKNTGSLIANEEQIKVIYDVNYKIMQYLQTAFPSIFKITDGNSQYSKKISITAPKGKTVNLLKSRPDDKIKEKYFASGNIQNIQSVLDKIASSSHPLNKIAKNLLKFTSINNAEIELVDVPYFENVNPNVEKSSGYYNLTDNKIYIAQKANVTNGLSETLLIHESIHAFTKNALLSDTKARSEFQKLYNIALSQLGVYDVNNKNSYYPLLDLDEFMVGIFTDPKFIKALQSIPPTNGIKYSNFFEEIYDWILNLLKLNSNESLYTQALGVASDILETEYFKTEQDRNFYNPEEPFLQKSSDETLPTNASPKTLKLIKDFLEKVGVDVNIVKEIVVNGVKYDANGVAQVMQQLISVVEGKEAQALPEEAMHFAVSIIKQTNPKLYQKLLKEINGYDMLNQVFKTYGSDPLYQKDGKPDVIKLKEEAIAKVLVDKIINIAEGTNENIDNLKNVQSWWKDIINWIKDLLYVKSGFDQVAINIISGKEIGTVEDISEEIETSFLQKSKQDNLYDNIIELSKRIEKPLDGSNKYVIDGREVSRVSDVVKTHYDNRQKNNDFLKDEYEIAVGELKKEKGTAGHADLENAFSLFIDENGYLKDAAIRKYNRENSNYIPELGSSSFYNTLVDNLEKRMESYPEGTRFIKEVAIYNGKNLAGTVDFIAITKEGKIDILDWKFMNLNQEYYNDVPWYKIESWNIQMDQYKKILISNYGISLKDFGQTRMIPILAEYSRGKKDKEGKVVELPKLTGVKIGDVNIKNISEEEDFLLPVPTKDEVSDNAELDTLIKKLNAAYERFAKEKITPDQKEAKREQLQSLFKAIRRLQVKRDVKPLIAQFKLLSSKVEKFYDKYNSVYKNPQDISDFSEEEMNEFSKEGESLLNAFNTYRDIHLLLKDIVDAEIKNELRDISDDAGENIRKISKINEEFTSEIIAKREGIESILSPEKIIKGITKAFSSTATLQVQSIQLLFKKANKALGKANFKTQEESSRLLELREKYMTWAKSKGLSSKDFFSSIKKKDKNELINQYKKEFYIELKKATTNGDVKWIKENIDINLYNEALEKEKAKKIEFIENKPRSGTPEEIIKEIKKETTDVENLYTISTDSSKGWYLYQLLRSFPLSKWETQEWQSLNSPENKPAKDFFDYIIEKNKEYANLGYISKQNSRVFLPYVKGSIVESAIKGDSLSMGDRFWKSISLDEGDVGYGQIDLETGKPINTIPKYFTRSFDAPMSEDLFKTMLLYNEAALRYKYLSEIEDQVKAIARVERNKKSILVSSIGNVERDEFGNIRYDPEGTEGNYPLLDSMIKSIIYGQRYVDNQNFDAAILKLGTWGKTINDKIGIKVFPENLDNRVITISKVVDNINNFFTLSTLGLNVGSSLSNFIGGSAQSVINSGKYFTKTDFVSAETQIMMNKFNGFDKNKYLKAFEYFLPLTDNYNRDLAKKLSVDVVTQESFQDFLMSLMRSGDRMVQATNFIAFLENSIVVDNKVVNAREYLRTLPEYKGKYEGNTEDRKKFNEEFDKKVKELIDEKGVMKLSTVENGKLIIPGVDRLSDSVLELRRKVQQLSKDAMGNLSDDDVRMINMTIVGKSFMVFKNWIPRLVDVRFGGLKYNSASDAYEWGRMRTLMNFLHEGLFKNFEGFTGLIEGNDKGVELMRQSFEKRAEKYELETGRKLQMDEALYMDLYQSNLKSVVSDMMLLIALAALTWAIKASIPDDDEDPEVINRYRFAARISDKLLDELMYFYNPTSILQLVGGGPFPSISIVNNAIKSIFNFFKEMYAIGTGDEKSEEDIKVLKYIMRTFPFTNQMSGYLPLIYPELAKDLGIRVQTNYGIR